MSEKMFVSNKRYIPDEIDRKKATSDDYWELHKMATAFKTAKDWGGALACLNRAKYLSVTIGSAVDVQSLCRLPLFLQQAGKFEEAKFELQELFENADAFAKQQASELNRSQALFQRKFKALFLEYLFDKARLIYKREKELEKSEEFARMSKSYQEEVDYIDELIEQQCEIDRQEYFREETEELLNGVDLLLKETEPKSTSKEDVKNMVVGFVGLVVIIWAIIHFVF